MLLLFFLCLEICKKTHVESFVHEMGSASTSNNNNNNNNNNNSFKGAAAYQLGNTSSRTITEVKQRWAQLVLGWVTVSSVA